MTQWPTKEKPNTELTASPLSKQTENHSAWCDAVRADFGKPAYETAATELDPFAKEIQDAINNVAKWSKPSKVSAGLQFALMRPRIYHEPKGVSLIIGAWNFPVLLVLQPLMAALAAGCPAIIKAGHSLPAVSPRSPLTIALCSPPRWLPTRLH